MTDSRSIARRVLLATTLVVAIACAPGMADAQSAYPTKPIRMVVPYAAGGGTDFFARAVGTSMSNVLGQPLVIENRPGAGTIIGAEAVAKAEPDGYTLLLGDTSTYASNQGLYRKLPYNALKDFAPITLTGRFAVVLLVNTDKLKVNSVAELIELAKKEPGKIDYASAGVGSPFHLAAELFAQTAGIKLNHVPYKGAGPAVQDLVGGQIGMMFVDYATGRSQLSNKNIKAIGVASPGEFSMLPGVPPISATLPGYEAWAWQGLSAPAKTSPEVVNKVNAAYAKAASDAALKKKLNDAGIDVLQSSPEEMAKYLASETAKWDKVIKAANIELQL